MQARLAVINSDIARLRAEQAELLAEASRIQQQEDDNKAAPATDPALAEPPVLARPADSFWDHQRDKVALASYPRSGNTLLRRILEVLTGTVTGSDSSPNRPLVRQLIEMGFAGEGVVDERVWLVKTHYPERAGHMRVKVTRVILLVRNPFDSIASNFQMLLTSSHTKSVCDEEFFTRFSRLWNDWILEEISMWTRFHEHWLEQSLPVLVVRYEDLIQHRTEQVARIASFLYGPFVTNNSVPAVRVHQGIERVAHMSEEAISLYKPRTGFEPQAIDDKQAIAWLDFSSSADPTKAKFSPLSLSKPGVLKSLHLYSDAQFHCVLACARSALCRFGYWDVCMQARPGAAPDLVGFVDRQLGQCLQAQADGSCLLNSQFGIRPRTPDDPYARGFDLRWDKRLRELPRACLKPV